MDNQARPGALPSARPCTSMIRLPETALMNQDRICVKLDRLPVEVIQNIASQCDARSILTLSRTNRHLRAACWHTLVLRHSLERHCDLWEENSFDIGSLSKSIRSSTEGWARFALADQCAFELRNGVEGGLAGENLQKSLLWAPYLVLYQRACRTRLCISFFDAEIEKIPSFPLLGLRGA